MTVLADMCDKLLKTQWQIRATGAPAAPAQKAAALPLFPEEP